MGDPGQLLPVLHSEQRIYSSWGRCKDGRNSFRYTLDTEPRLCRSLCMRMKTKGLWRQDMWVGIKSLMSRHFQRALEQALAVDPGFEWCRYDSHSFKAGLDALRDPHTPELFLIRKGMQRSVKTVLISQVRWQNPPLKLYWWVSLVFLAWTARSDEHNPTELVINDDGMQRNDERVVYTSYPESLPFFLKFSCLLSYIWLTHSISSNSSPHCSWGSRKQAWLWNSSITSLLFTPPCTSSTHSQGILDNL